MAIIRLAKVADYERFSANPDLWVVSWEPRMGPGNPTDDPQTGVALFNDWQCAIAAGKEPVTDPAGRLEKTVEYCREYKETAAAKRLAADMVAVNRNHDCFINLDFDKADYPGRALDARSELVFLHAAMKSLPAKIILELKGIANEQL